MSELYLKGDYRLSLAVACPFCGASILQKCRSVGLLNEIYQYHFVTHKERVREYKRLNSECGNFPKS